MAEIGIMVYGFSKDEAETIRTSLQEINKEDVILISGCGREEHILGDILEDELYDTFEDKEDPRVIMFLGFDGQKINASMDNFPKLEGSRPIFCTPTEKNIGWKLSALLEDLVEEREYFRQKQKEKQQS
jgi:hypothetical protein